MPPAVRTLLVGLLLLLLCTGRVCCADPRVGPDAVELISGSHALPVSLCSPRMVLGDRRCEPAAPAAITGSLAEGQTLTVTYPPLNVTGGTLEVQTLLTWSVTESVLRKWARCRLTAGAPVVLHEIVLESLPSDNMAPLPPYSGQSYPAFFAGFFAGIEFPTCSTRMEGVRLLLAHRPGVTLTQHQWWESKRAVYAPVPIGGEREAFERYVRSHRVKPARLHFSYNSWWTSPVPYSEGDIKGLLGVFRDHLSKPTGVSFDSFCIDAGWSDAQTVWQIQPSLFPQGFTGIQQAAAEAGTHLGIWISPSSAYSFALDGEWAQSQGYETFKQGEGRYACLAGKRYQEAFRQRLVEMVTRYGLRQIKLDGYLRTCPEAGHGHQPGEESADAIAEGLISVLAAVRKAAPEVWIEPTCFGWNPSPWWLWHVNSVIGTYGDDAPYGRVPCPVYRESYTTARDYFNLQGAARLTVPIAAQEVLGICHQTPDDFTNDAVVCILRGHQFLPVYLNPAFMSPSRWQVLASLMRWAREHQETLAVTRPLLPVTWQNGRVPAFSNDAAMPRDPYGYAHWLQGKGLVCLRNPWIRAGVYQVPVPAHLPAGCSAVGLYPEPRLYAKKVTPGKELVVHLAPYETVVIAVAPGQSLAGLPPCEQLEKVAVKASTNPAPTVRRVTFSSAEATFGPDWTALIAGQTATELIWEGEVEIRAPQAELLVLLEDAQPVAVPFGTLQVDGEEVPWAVADSATGWAASGLPPKEHWVFLRAPMQAGFHKVAMRVLSGEQGSLSVWLWGKKAAAWARPAPGRLPSPEIVSLSSEAVVVPTDLAVLPAATATVARPITRIQGVYLDTVEPVSVAQGYGKLERNRSVWEKPLQIGNQRFLRGLGTHAPARIVYHLGRRYRRFQAWVGADHATGPTVTFEVWVDGVKRFESGLMRREDVAQRVDIEVTGASRLELVVGDGGNGIAADHADWAEAVLLK